MSNPGMRLTRAGKNILAQGLLGDEIHFTKVAFGDADFDYETESLLDLTELKSWKMDLPIVGKKLDGDGTVTIVALCSNFQLEKGFAAKEIGVFATDQASGDEVLYSYRNAGDEYNFIPAKTGVVTKSTRYAYKIEIGDAENVTFNINFSFAYVSQEDFEREKLATKAELNALKVRVIELWHDKLNLSGAEIAAILDGSYVPTGLTGDGEFNGVPTQTNIDNIIAGNFVSYDPPTDDFAITDIPSEAEINAIISGTYGGAPYVSAIPTEDDINAIIAGTYST